MKKFALIAVLALSAPVTHAAASAEIETFDVLAWLISFFESDDAEAVDGGVIEASLANIDTALGLGPR